MTLLPLADPEPIVDTEVTTSVTALPLSLVDPPAATPPAPLAAEEPEDTKMEPLLPDGALATLLAELPDELAADPAPATEALERLLEAEPSEALDAPEADDPLDVP